MENKSNVKSLTLRILDKIQTLSNKIELLTEEIKNNNAISDETFAKISSYYSEIINLLNNHKDKNKYFEGLTLQYEEKKRNLIKLWEITEVKKSLEITEPEQKNNDMFYNVIDSCIKACENLKKNNMTSKKFKDNKNSDINAKGNQVENTLNIDVEKLEDLYKELLNCDEISEFLYSEITNQTTELGQIYERFSDENEKII